MAAIGLLGFCKNIITLDTVRGLVTVSGPNFVLIGQTIAQIWRLVDFFIMAAARQLGFVL